MKGKFVFESLLLHPKFLHIPLILVDSVLQNSNIVGLLVDDGVETC
jgi:hypothetical protein